MSAGLYFIPSGGGHYTSPTACVDKYEDTGHETIVRELTQNALDAATREAVPKRPCKLVFEIRNVSTSLIPGATECLEHLSYMRDWEQPNRQDYNDVLRNLRQQYGSTEVTCLFVRDNGVGLDADRMEKLFGEGASGKSESDGASGGTHGVGHKTAFAAGDMNYVLYGGVSIDKLGKVRRTASGHVAFPSHGKQDGIDDFKRWTGHAFLARDIIQPTLIGVEVITNQREIPSIIDMELDRIWREHGSGSVVIIPAFNYFFDEGKVVDLICEDIAKHFFAAIDQGRLCVTVCDHTEANSDKSLMHTLQCRKDVDEILSRPSILKDLRRKSKTQIVTGFRISEAWKTWKFGKTHQLQTSFGKIKAFVRYTDSGPRRICVLRAGMYITDDDADMPASLKRSQFTSRKPFHAILHFADNIEIDEVKADQILRDAENHGHTGIRSNKRDGMGKSWQPLCKEIKERLLVVLEENPRNDSFTPEILPIVVRGADGWRQPIPVSPLPVVPYDEDNENEPDPDPDPNPDPSPNPDPDPNPDPRPPRKVGRPIEIASTARPGGPDQLEVEIIVPKQPVKDALIQLQTRTGSDGTCEQPLRGRSIEFDLARSLHNGKVLGKFTSSEVPIGKVEAGSRIRLSLQLVNGEDADLQLQAVMYRRRRKR